MDKDAVADYDWVSDAVAHFGGRTIADLPGYRHESYGPWERWVQDDAHQDGGEWVACSADHPDAEQNRSRVSFAPEVVAFMRESAARFGIDVPP